jgi:hypothetical protein
VLTVNGDGDEVERRLAGGELACPSCGGVLGGWGNARQRPVRTAEGPDAVLVPRRSRCRGCGATHVPPIRPGSVDGPGHLFMAAGENSAVAPGIRLRGIGSREDKRLVRLCNLT